MQENIIEKITLEITDIPSLPLIAVKVLNLVQDDYSSFLAFEEIISQDQGFTTRLLKIANSTYYGQNRKIETIKQALLLIGFETFKFLVIATALRDLHRKFDTFEQKLWEHSLGVALCSSLIATMTSLVKPEEALVYGLIHDIGKTIINNSMPDVYPEVYKKMYETGVTVKHIESEMFGFDHAVLGAFLLKKWNFPKKFETVIAHHHTYPFPDHENIVCANMCNVVRVSDQICINIGIGLKNPLKVPIDYESLNLTKKDLLKLMKQFEVNFEKQKKELLT